MNRWRGLLVLLGRSRDTWLTTIALLAVFGLTLLVRYVSLESIEIGGDALRVWEFGRRLAYGARLPSELDHHQARFGLVLPTLALQKLVGARAVHYYLGPLMMGALLHAAVFFIALRLSGALAASTAVLWLWLFSEMGRPSSQILPELYGPAYTMLAVALSFVYLDARSKWVRAGALVATGLALFFAYGSKLSYLYFAPGCAAFFLWGHPRKATPSEPLATSRWRAALTWLARRRLLQAGLLTLLVVSLIGLETLTYRLLTSQESQLAVVEKTHGLSTSATVKTTSDLFAIYRNAGGAWHRALATGGVVLALVLGLARDRRARLFALLSVVYVLLFTFILRRWNPPVPWAQPHPRYLLAIAPCIAVLFGVAAEELVRLPFRWVKERYRAASLRVVTVGVGIGLLAWGAFEPSRALAKGLRSSHAITRTERLSRDMTRAFVGHLPLVTTTKPPKPLIAAASVYIEPDALVRQGRILLPNEIIRSTRARARRPLYYLARDIADRPTERKAFAEEIERRVKKSRCVVQMTQYGRFFRMTPKRTRDCPARLDEPHAP